MLDDGAKMICRIVNMSNRRGKLPAAEISCPARQGPGPSAKPRWGLCARVRSQAAGRNPRRQRYRGVKRGTASFARFADFDGYPCDCASLLRGVNLSGSPQHQRGCAGDHVVDLADVVVLGNGIRRRRRPCPIINKPYSRRNEIVGTTNITIAAMPSAWL
jgi:hypothetical protein